MPKIDIVNAKNIIESNPEKAFFKLKNTGGPKGDTGAQGPQGPKGDTGAQGPAGASASVTVGSTTTLSPGADATVTNSGDTRNAILNFGIPTGARGPKGDTGSKGDTGPMGPKGPKGDTGAAATVQVGNTNTGAPGTNAQVTNAGNEHFAVFNFTIPRGDKGEKGTTGAQGPQGPKGDTGAQGPQGIQGPKGDTGSVKSDVVAELPETGEEDTFYLVNREATEQTATGKAINFTNSDNSGDITDFKLDGETSQNGTPTPDAPVAVNTTTGENVVKITGKNLFDKTNSNLLLSNVYIGSSSLGTSSGAYTAFIECSPNTTYTISKTAGARFICGTTTILPATGVSIANRTADNTASSITLTTSSTAKYLVVFYFLSSADSGTQQAMLDSLQFESGSTATAYEPYQGQSYEVNLGKNLCDLNATFPLDINGVTVTKEADGSVTLNGTLTSNTNITFSQNNIGDLKYLQGQMATLSFSTSGIGSISNIGLKQSGAAVFETATSPKTVTVDFGTKTSTTWQAWCISGTVYNNFNLKVQLEKGSQATSYAAYFEPIELCKIGDYQDYIYKSGGKWYVHKAVGEYQLDGTESWGTATNGYILAANSQSPFYNILALGAPSYESLCSHFYFQPNAQTWTGDKKCGFSPTGTFWVMYAAPADKNAFLAWLGQTKPSIYFPLATPTDTEITNQALIAQLDNVASAPLYTGVNNITTITQNEQGTLEIKYVTYDKYNQNKVYIWNDTLQQWQIIVP